MADTSCNWDGSAAEGKHGFVGIDTWRPKEQQDGGQRALLICLEGGCSGKGAATGEARIAWRMGAATLSMYASRF